jgi:hyperosmotically inducible protein
MKLTNNNPKNTLTDKNLTVLCLSMLLVLAGCQKEGPAEKAGQKIDTATENTEKKIELLTEKAETKIEAAKDVVDQKATEGKEAINQSTDAAKAELDSAGKHIDQANETAEHKLEAGKDLIEQKADIAKENINNSIDASKTKLDDASKKLELATDKAENKVENKVEGIKESVLDKAKAAGEYLEDGSITATVKAAIANDSIFKASHIEVTTTNGVVQLTGTVDSEPVIGRALEVVGSQKHVKSVQSTLIVSTSASSTK